MPPPPAPPRLCLRAAPHGDSVLSVAFSSHYLLASGGEDCALILHDLRCCYSSSPSASTSTSATSSNTPAARSLFADPVAALAWQGEHALYCGSGNRVHLLDTRKLGGASSDNKPSSSAAAAAAVVVGAFDDEVSSLSVSRDGKTLAVADDSGAVSLLDISRTAERIGIGGGEEGETGTSSSSSLASSVATLSVADHCFLPSRRLPRAHAGSLATAVAFRPGRAGESLVSGGCDCSLARWDACSGRLVRRWQAREIAGEDGGGEEGGGGAAEGVEGLAGGAAMAPPSGSGGSISRVFNPPFVHALAVPSSSAAKPWSGCVAAALGDGSVAVLDCEAKAEARHPRKEKDKRNKSGSSSSSPLLISSPLPAFSGVLAVLRPEEGGHSAAATCVAFGAEAEAGGETGTGGGFSPAPLVASGGDDGRLLFWRWARSAVEELYDEGEGPRRRNQRQQLPAAWEAALGPFRGGAGGAGGGGGRGSVVVAAAAAASGRRWKMQALAAASSESSFSLVAAADTSRVVKVYRVE